MSRAVRRLLRHRSVQVGAALVLVWVLLAVLATTLTGYDGVVDPDVGLDQQLIRPSIVGGTPGSPRFLLGTDLLGHDMLGRVLLGARTSLIIGAMAVAIALVIGVPLGLAAGYAGGWTDAVVMRGTDVLLALPAILLAICVVAVLGQSLTNLMVAVGLVNAPTIARQLRAQVLVVRELEFVQAARALGLSPVRIALVHVLPNCAGPILVLATLATATAILETAGLSFVGLGPPSGTAEWGLMIAENRALVTKAPWTILAPGAAIVLLVLGFNLLGDGLRDVLDPRGKR